MLEDLNLSCTHISFVFFSIAEKILIRLFVFPEKEESTFFR